MSDEKIYQGAVIILYQKSGNDKLYVVVENQTGNITFPAGAKEDFDNTLQDTAQREVTEELGLKFEDYSLKPTDVSYEFVFGPQKKERAGAKGVYAIFIGEIKSDILVKATSELKSVKLMTAAETIHSLSFDDLRDIFRELIDYGHLGK